MYMIMKRLSVCLRVETVYVSFPAAILQTHRDMRGKTEGVRLKTDMKRKLL